MGARANEGGAERHPNYVAVWIWLMALAILSVAASRLPIDRTFVHVIVYVAAFAKALLVGIFFMHLRTERILILCLVAIPLALFVILTVSLLPDFVFALAGT